MELGAVPSHPFTDRVTHLVAVDHGGPKYMVSVLFLYRLPLANLTAAVCLGKKGTYLKAIVDYGKLQGMAAWG